MMGKEEVGQAYLLLFESSVKQDMPTKGKGGRTAVVTDVVIAVVTDVVIAVVTDIVIAVVTDIVIAVVIDIGIAVVTDIVIILSSQSSLI
jgi:hypothetical protein